MPHCPGTAHRCKPRSAGKMVYAFRRPLQRMSMLRCRIPGPRANKIWIVSSERPIRGVATLSPSASVHHWSSGPGAGPPVHRQSVRLRQADARTFWQAYRACPQGRECSPIQSDEPPPRSRKPPARARGRANCLSVAGAFSRSHCGRRSALARVQAHPRAQE